MAQVPWGCHLSHCVVGGGGWMVWTVREMLNSGTPPPPFPPSAARFLLYPSPGLPWLPARSGFPMWARIDPEFLLTPSFPFFPLFFLFFHFSFLPGTFLLPRQTTSG